VVEWGPLCGMGRLGYLVCAASSIVALPIGWKGRRSTAPVGHDSFT